MNPIRTPQARCRFAVAEADITPPAGIYHRMWGAATHDRAEGVHRPLRATVVAIVPLQDASGAAGVSDDSSASGAAGAAGAAGASGAATVEATVAATKLPPGTAILASLDHCLVGAVELEMLLAPITEATGVPREAMTILFTHTHGAGLMMLDRQTLPGGDLIPSYLQMVGQRLAELVGQSLKQLKPATMVFGKGRCDLAVFRDQWDGATGQFVCGYDPAVPADDTLLVARVAGDSGETLATFVNYACHPTTLAWDNRLVSPDYIGAMRELIERETGAPCLFLQGASGELGPYEGYVGDVAVADRNGRRVGFAALAAIEALPPPGTCYGYAGPVVSGATIGVWRHEPMAEEELADHATWRYRRWEIALPYRAELPTAATVAAELDQWRAAETRAMEAGDLTRARDCRAMVERQTRMARRLEQLPPGETYPLEVRLWRWGGADFLAVPGEHYSLLQTALRAVAPQRALLIATIAQGWGPSYLPTSETYGRGIYQETIAIVAPGSLERVVADVERVLREWDAGAVT